MTDGGKSTGTVRRSYFNLPIIFLINRLVIDTSSSQFPRAQRDVFRFLLLSNQQLNQK